MSLVPGQEVDWTQVQHQLASHLSPHFAATAKAAMAGGSTQSMPSPPLPRAGSDAGAAGGSATPPAAAGAAVASGGDGAPQVQQQQQQHQQQQAQAQQAALLQALVQQYLGLFQSMGLVPQHGAQTQQPAPFPTASTSVPLLPPATTASQVEASGVRPSSQLPTFSPNGHSSGGEAGATSNAAVQNLVQATLLQALQNGQLSGQALTSMLGANSGDAVNELASLLGAAMFPQQASQPQPQVQTTPQHMSLSPSFSNGKMEPETPGQSLGPVAGSGGVASSSREKNRQAQRRFRERQKGLIITLKKQVETLGNKVEESQRELIALREENRVLKMTLESAKSK